MSQLSLVVSVYNEADVLQMFWSETREVLKSISNYQIEVIFVNDGSTDDSQRIIDSIVANESMCSFQSIEFSRNFGHEAAMIAGIDHAGGDVIICLDSDLQHPPASITEMLSSYESGVDIVTMHRKERKDGGFLKKRFGRWFYRLLNNLSDFRFEENASDFFLISARVATILRENFRERNRFLRGYIQIIGFDKQTVYYTAQKRAAGESKYSLRSLFNLANIAIFSFSRKPLYFAMVMAVSFMILAIILTLYTIAVYLWGSEPPPGYTTIIAFLSLSFAILFFILAIQSLYLGRGMEEIKERPLYIVKNVKSDRAEATES